MEHTERTKAEQIANAYFDMGAGWSASGGLLKELREMEGGYIKSLADAQATIAALQARVKELEGVIRQVRPEIHCMIKQLTGAGYREGASVREAKEAIEDAIKADALDVSVSQRQQITQLQADLARVTAELEAANKHCEIIEEHKAEAYKEVEIQLLAKANLQAELERVRGELAETKEEVTCLDEQVSALNQGCLEYERLIKALPKVEGEITVGTHFNSSYISMGRCGHLDGVTFARKEDADAYADLLKHRQGMEG